MRTMSNIIISKNIFNDNLMQVTGISEYMDSAAELVKKLPTGSISDVILALEEARLHGKKIVILGNGGSAATALHFACDLSKGAITTGKPRFKVFTLTDNIALLTAWANDNMYRNSFAEQIENLIDSEDVVIAISASGNSWNVINAMKVARAKGARTIALTGSDGGQLKQLADLVILVPSNNTEQIEDMHLLIEHAMTACLRELP